MRPSTITHWNKFIQQQKTALVNDCIACTNTLLFTCLLQLIVAPLPAVNKNRKQPVFLWEQQWKKTHTQKLQLQTLEWTWLWLGRGRNSVHFTIYSRRQWRGRDTQAPGVLLWQGKHADSVLQKSQNTPAEEELLPREWSGTLRWPVFPKESVKSFGWSPLAGNKPISTGDLNPCHVGGRRQKWTSKGVEQWDHPGEEGEGKWRRNREEAKDSEGSIYD